MSQSRQLAQSVPNQLNAIAKRMENNLSLSAQIMFITVGLFILRTKNSLAKNAKAFHNKNLEEYGPDEAASATEHYLNGKFILDIVAATFFVTWVTASFGNKALNRAANFYANQEVERRAPKLDSALRFGLFYIAPEQPRQAENNPEQAPAPQHN